MAVPNPKISVDTLHHYIDKVDQDGSNQLLGHRGGTTPDDFCALTNGMGV